MSVAVAVIAFIVTVPVSVSISMAVVVMVFVLAVVVAVVVAVLFAEFMPVELLFPAAMAAPVGVFAANGERAVVAVARIEVTIDVAMEADWAAEPWACSEEDSATEPGRSVIAEWGAAIWRVVVVAVGADWLDADVDRDLDLGSGRGGSEAEKRKKSKCNDAQ